MENSNRIRALEEQRNTLVGRIEALQNLLETEKRMITDEENQSYKDALKDIERIDDTLSLLRSARVQERTDEAPSNEQHTKEQEAEKRWLDYIRGNVRADHNVAANISIIPQHLTSRVIDIIKETCPIYAMATKFNVGGDLVFPKWNGELTIDYVDDMQEFTSSAGSFSTVKLENHIFGGTTLVSRSLINRSDTVDVLNYVVRKLGQAMAYFFERELVAGETNLQGVITGEVGVTSAKADAISFDEILDLQMSIPQAHQSKAIWIMNRKTFAGLRKLKDQNGVYLLNFDVRNPFGWTILGKNVYLTDSMPEMAADQPAVVYGDMSALYLKMAQNIETVIQRETHAQKHAIGLVISAEADSAVIEPQKIATLKMASA